MDLPYNQTAEAGGQRRLWTVSPANWKTSGREPKIEQTEKGETDGKDVRTAEPGLFQLWQPLHWKRGVLPVPDFPVRGGDDSRGLPRCLLREGAGA